MGSFHCSFTGRNGSPGSGIGGKGPLRVRLQFLMRASTDRMSECSLLHYRV